MGVLDEIANPMRGVPSYLENLRIAEDIKYRQSARQTQEVQTGRALEQMMRERETQAGQAQGRELIRSALQRPEQPGAEMPPEAAAEGPPIGGKKPAAESNVMQFVLDPLNNIPTEKISRAQTYRDLGDQLLAIPGNEEVAGVLYKASVESEKQARLMNPKEREQQQLLYESVGNTFFDVAQMEDAGKGDLAKQYYEQTMDNLINDPRFQDNEQMQQLFNQFKDYRSGMGKYMYTTTMLGKKARDQFQKEPRKLQEGRDYGDKIESVAQGKFNRTYGQLTIPERKEVLAYIKSTSKEIAAAQAGVDLKLQEPRRVEKAEIVVNKAQEAFDMVSHWTTGLGSILKMIPGTDAKDLEIVIDTIQANIGFEELNSMREESKTGGALGQVTVREIKLLQSVIAGMSQAQSPGALRKNLLEVQTRYQKVVDSYELMTLVKGKTINDTFIFNGKTFVITGFDENKEPLIQEVSK